MISILFALVLLLISVPASALTQAEIKTYIDAQWTANQSAFNSDADSGNGQVYYKFQYPLMGWLAAYEAFVDTAYLTRVLGYAETMVSKATNIDSCSKKSWAGPYNINWTNQLGGTCNMTNGASWLEEIQGSTEMARVVAIIKTDNFGRTSGLNTTYGARADTIRTFLHEHIIQKWMVYRSGQATLTLQPWGDQSVQTFNILVSMDQAGYSNTNIKSGLTYRQFAVQYLNAYMATVSAPGGNTPCGRGTCIGGIAGAGAEIFHHDQYTGTSWCFGTPEPCSLDTSHANRWPAALQRAVNAGYGTTITVDAAPTGSTLPQHVEKLALLMSKIIWDGSTSVPRFTNFSNGENQAMTSANYAAWENGFVSSGWAFVAHHNPDALSAMLGMTNCVMADCGSTSRRFNAGSGHTRTAMAGTTALAQYRATAAAPPSVIVNAPSSVRAPVSDRPSVGGPAAAPDRPVATRPVP